MYRDKEVRRKEELEDFHYARFIKSFIKIKDKVYEITYELKSIELTNQKLNYHERT